MRSNSSYPAHLASSLIADGVGGVGDIDAHLGSASGQGVIWCSSPRAIVTCSISISGSSSFMLVTMTLRARSTVRCESPVTSQNRLRALHCDARRFAVDDRRHRQHRAGTVAQDRVRRHVLHQARVRLSGLVLFENLAGRELAGRVRRREAQRDEAQPVRLDRVIVKLVACSAYPDRTRRWTPACDRDPAPSADPPADS